VIGRERRLGIGSVRVRAQTPEPVGPTGGKHRPISNRFFLGFFRFLGCSVLSVSVRFSLFRQVTADFCFWSKIDFLV
jgi:hypothetical protein